MTIQPVFEPADAPEYFDLADLIRRNRPAWMVDGACRGYPQEWWFPEGAGLNQLDARAVCAECPVRQECLDYAIENGEDFGMWGGKSQRERRRIRRSLHHIKGPAAESLRRKPQHGETPEDPA